MPESDVVDGTSERSQAARDRLRRLRLASELIVADLSLPVVLRQITSAARDLVEAGYAALGVIGHDGQLEEFVHVGLDEAAAARLGSLPQGLGILGFLVDHPSPIRIADLSAHPAAVGFPPGHPPMGSFLGVPIRVRNHVFGNLYLTDSASGQFSAEDEHLVIALAATAGIAIANARLHHEVEQQRQWLAASTELTQQLFGTDPEASADAVLRYALRGAAASLAALTMPVSATTVRVQAASGPGSQLTGQLLGIDDSLAGLVIRSGKPVLVNDYASRFDAAGVAEFGRAVGPAISVPLLAADSRVLAALTMARAPGAAVFNEIDRDQLAGFANHAALALELDRARTESESLRKVEDHDRIAADLHDHVIQELFATGMGLESMVNSLQQPVHRARIIGYVDALDATIRRIRSTIFALQPAQSLLGGVQARLLAVIGEEASALGYAATIEFSGPLDLVVSPAVADDLIAVVREALSNIARHAAATTAGVAVHLIGSLLRVEVIDNGIGPGETTRSSGLANLRHRAEARGGSLDLAARPAGGSCLRWTAILD